MGIKLKSTDKLVIYASQQAIKNMLDMGLSDLFINQLAELMAKNNLKGAYISKCGRKALFIHLATW
jgi:hypothetical protein